MIQMSITARNILEIFFINYCTMIFSLPGLWYMCQRKYCSWATGSEATYFTITCWSANTVLVKNICLLTQYSHTILHAWYMGLWEFIKTYNSGLCISSAYGIHFSFRQDIIVLFFAFSAGAESTWTCGMDHYLLLICCVGLDLKSVSLLITSWKVCYSCHCDNLMQSEQI